jgi:hypothetical protein
MDAPVLTHTASRSSSRKCRVPLDKSEGTVKDIVVLGSAKAPLFLPERLRTKTLEISRGIIFQWKDRSTNHRFGLNINHDSSMRTSRPVRDVRAPKRTTIAVSLTAVF